MWHARSSYRNQLPLSRRPVGAARSDRRIQRNRRWWLGSSSLTPFLCRILANIRIEQMRPLERSDALGIGMLAERVEVVA